MPDNEHAAELEQRLEHGLVHLAQAARDLLDETRTENFISFRLTRSEDDEDPLEVVIRRWTGKTPENQRRAALARVDELLAKNSELVEEARAARRATRAAEISRDVLAEKLSRIERTLDDALYDALTPKAVFEELALLFPGSGAVEMAAKPVQEFEALAAGVVESGDHEPERKSLSNALRTIRHMRDLIGTLAANAGAKVTAVSLFKDNGHASVYVTAPDSVDESAVGLAVARGLSEFIVKREADAAEATESGGTRQRRKSAAPLPDAFERREESTPVVDPFMGIKVGDTVEIGVDERDATCGPSRADAIVSWRTLGTVHALEVRDGIPSAYIPLRRIVNKDDVGWWVVAGLRVRP